MTCFAPISEGEEFREHISSVAFRVRSLLCVQHMWKTRFRRWFPRQKRRVEISKRWTDRILSEAQGDEDRKCLSNVAWAMVEGGAGVLSRPLSRSKRLLCTRASTFEGWL